MYVCMYVCDANPLAGATGDLMQESDGGREKNVLELVADYCVTVGLPDGKKLNLDVKRPQGVETGRGAVLGGAPSPEANDRGVVWGLGSRQRESLVTTNKGNCNNRGG